MNSALPIQLRGAASLVSRKRRALEGYGVDKVVFFTRWGAPNTADCPLLPPITAQTTPPKQRRITDGRKIVQTARFGGEKVRIASGRSVDFFTHHRHRVCALSGRCAPSSRIPNGSTTAPQKADVHTHRETAPAPMEVVSGPLHGSVKSGYMILRLSRKRVGR